MNKGCASAEVINFSVKAKSFLPPPPPQYLAHQEMSKVSEREGKKAEARILMNTAWPFCLSERKSGHSREEEEGGAHLLSRGETKPQETASFQKANMQLTDRLAGSRFHKAGLNIPPDVKKAFC